MENMGIRFYNNINSQLAIKLMNCDETVIKEDQCNAGVILKKLKNNPVNKFKSSQTFVGTASAYTYMLERGIPRFF